LKFLIELFKHIHWFRLGWLIVFPLMLCLLLFNPWEKTYLSKTVERSSINFFVSTLEPSPQETIRTSLSVPFDLKWYNVYFEHNQTLQSQTPTFFRIELNNGKSLALCPNNSNSILVNLENGFSGSVTYVESEGTFNPCLKEEAKTTNNSLTLTDGGWEMTKPAGPLPLSTGLITVYAQPEKYSIFAKWALFMLAWWSISLVMIEVLKQLGVLGILHNYFHNYCYVPLQIAIKKLIKIK